jgi:hypothetical protein
MGSILNLRCRSGPLSTSRSSTNAGATTPPSAKRLARNKRSSVGPAIDGACWALVQRRVLNRVSTPFNRWYDLEAPPQLPPWSPATQVTVTRVGMHRPLRPRQALVRQFLP